MAFGIDDILAALGAVNKVAGKAADTGQSLGNLFGMLPKPNYSKLDATGAQEQLIKTAQAIQQAVGAGTMDVDAALAALDALDRSALTLAAQSGSNLDYARGISTARQIITSVKGYLQSSRTNSANAPIGEKGLYGTPGFQKDQFGHLIRNAMIGHESGKQLEGSPAGDLLKPRQSPIDMMPEAAAKVQSTFPNRNPIDDDFAAKIRQQLQQAATKKLEY